MTVPEEHQRKKQKTKKEKTYRPNQCEFFMVKKRRRCAMQRKEGHQFCSEHIMFDETPAAKEAKGDRIPCPLDPNHTVKATEMESHLKKCNVTTKQYEPWYELNINSVVRNSEEAEEKEQPDLSLKDLSELELYNKFIPVLREFGKDLQPLEVQVKEHPGLESWTDGKQNNRHTIQHSSLIGNLKHAGMFSPKAYYVEFGCGRAELSRAVNTCILHEYKESKSYGYGMIDRGVNRMKMDTKIEKDCADHKVDVSIKRSRIDIQHLSLDKFLESEAPISMVGISKHLCGVATDLTLKLILNSSYADEKFGGLLVAMCCRHACQYAQLLPQSREFLKKHGFSNETSFGVLKKMVPWAVCGRGSKDPEETSNHMTGLPYEEREELGLMARRLIDESRVHAIKLLMPRFEVELFQYAARETTLENSCLCIRKRQTEESI